MTPTTRALACPRCGGTLVLLPSQRVVRCPWCSALDLVDTGAVIARSLATPLLTRSEAHSIMVANLSHPELRSGLPASVKIAPPRLFFVPFFELQARRAGRARFDRERTAGSADENPASFTFPTGGVDSQPTSIFTRPKRTEVETKVVLSSWSFYWPAVELPGWGLGQVTPQRLRGSDGPELEPFDLVKAAGLGTAFEPTVDAEAFRSAALRAAPSRASNVTAIEERLSVLYYPLWRAGYTCDGRTFWITIDGITGAVLRLAGPPSRERMALRLVAACAAIGCVAALLSRMALAVDGDLSQATAGIARLGAPLVLLAAAVLSARQAAASLASLADVVLVRRGEGLERQ